MSTLDKKVSTEESLIETLSAYPDKVGFVRDDVLTNALKYIEENSVPDAKHEEYKYCNISGLLKKNFKSFHSANSSFSKEEIHSFLLNDSINIVLVNGKYNKELSDNYAAEDGLYIHSIENTPDNLKDNYLSRKKNLGTDYFEALSTAFSGRGICIEIGKGSSLSKPIHLLHLNSSEKCAVVSARNLIVLQENSTLQLFETFLQNGKENIFNPVLSEVFLAKESTLHHSRLQNQGTHGFHVNNFFVFQEEQSSYTNDTIILEGELVRNNLVVSLQGQEAETKLNGLFIAANNQLIDNHTVVDHAVPNCNSNELYKGILNGKSNGVFNGKIFVQPDAQKTNAYQSSKNILLSDEASINTKPQLEIYADDVKCSHGTSTGMLDEEALFYLKSRGIGEENAKRLLLYAFASEIIDQLPESSFSEKVSALFNSKLHI